MARHAAARRLLSALFVTFILPFAGSSPAAAATGRLSGSVADPHGRAVPAAVVRLDAPAGPARETRTRSDGTFAFDEVAEGRFRVRVFADGLQADPQDVTVAAGDAGVRVAIAMRVAAVSDTIVVSAAGSALPLSTLPASVTVLGRDDLRVAQSETVADALRRVTGLGVAANGGRGALTSLFTRGGESDYTLVLLDGIRLNSFGGGFDAAHLQVEGVERVEVVRGPQSALFGGDAVSGVVQMVSPTVGPLTVSALGEGGSGDTSRATAATSGSLGAWSWHASGQYQQSQGRNGERTAQDELVVNDDYTARHVTAGGGWQHARGSVRSLVRWISTVRGNPGPFGADPNGTFTGIDAVSRGTNDQVTAGLALAQVLGPSVRLRADATVADLDSGFRSAFGDSVTETRRATGRAQLDWSASDRVVLAGGAEVLRERALNTFITGSGSSPLPIERDIAGAFAEARYDDGARVLIAAGLRAEHITREALPGSDGFFTPRPAFPSDTVVSWNPRIAASWVVVPMRGPRGTSTRLKVNAGTGIRPPDAFEIAFTDNPGLRPERSRSVDAGVEQLLAGGRVALDAVWFANRYDDLIVAVGRSFEDSSRYRTDNVSNARARGLELSASARWSTGVALRGGSTWLDTAILAVDGSGVAPPPFAVGDPLIRRPRRQGFADLTFVGSRVDAFVRLTARGETLDVDPTLGAFGGTLKAPGYLVGDAGVTVRPFGRAAHAVFLRVTNVGDRQYEEALGFPALGRSVIVGLRLAHGR
jgi:outer membrane cobalamin receptor